MATKKKKNTKNTNTLASYVSKVSSTINAAESAFPIDSPVLGPEDKKHGVKVRKGAENVIRQLAELAKTHELDSTGLHSEDMLEELNTSTSLAPLLATIEKISKRISDAQYSAQSGAYDKALQFYALLQRRAQTDGQLADALAPINEFFSYRHQAVLDAKPTKLQTRMNTKLKNAERLVARSKPRASVLEQEHDDAQKTASAPTASAPAASPAPAAAPQPSVIVVQQPAAPAASQPAASSVTIVPPTPVTNGVTNGASNGYVNGASNGAAST